MWGSAEPNLWTSAQLAAQWLDWVNTAGLPDFRHCLQKKTKISELGTKDGINNNLHI